MPFEPLRFLHAANIRLDHAIGETYKLPPRVASIVQDATRAAFERLIGVALDRRVDFLLLAGNTFVEAEQSLAARLALLDGLEQLAQESIRVFVLPGAPRPRGGLAADSRFAAERDDPRRPFEGSPGVQTRWQVDRTHRHFAPPWASQGAACVAARGCGPRASAPCRSPSASWRRTETPRMRVPWKRGPRVKRQATPRPRKMSPSPAG